MEPFSGVLDVNNISMRSSGLFSLARGPVYTAFPKDLKLVNLRKVFSNAKAEAHFERTTKKKKTSSMSFSFRLKIPRGK